MTEKTTGLKSIWYFVGLVLMVMGALVIISGLVQLITPVAQTTVLYELRPALWWGAIMFVTGTIYYLLNRTKTVD